MLSACSFFSFLLSFLSLFLSDYVPKITILSSLGTRMVYGYVRRNIFLWNPHVQGNTKSSLSCWRLLKPFTSYLPYQVPPSFLPVLLTCFMFPCLVPFLLYNLKCCEIQNVLFGLHLSFSLHSPTEWPYPLSLSQYDRWIPKSLA